MRRGADPQRRTPAGAPRAGTPGPRLTGGPAAPHGLRSSAALESPEWVWVFGWGRGEMAVAVVAAGEVGRVSTEFQAKPQDLPMD